MPRSLQVFSDTLTKIYVASGVPHSLAKVLVYLTVCEPAQQAALDIQNRLQLSAGSVSTALNGLRRAGLIVRSKTPGDKRYLYELENKAWERSIMQRLSSLDHLVAVAKEGRELMPHNERLTAMEDMYQYFGDECKGIMRRFAARKK